MLKKIVFTLLMFSLSAQTLASAVKFPKACNKPLFYGQTTDGLNHVYACTVHGKLMIDLSPINPAAGGVGYTTIGDDKHNMIVVVTQANDYGYNITSIGKNITLSIRGGGEINGKQKPSHLYVYKTLSVSNKPLIDQVYSFGESIENFTLDNPVVEFVTKGL